MTVQTSLGGGTSVVQGLFIEMMLTAELVFTIFMLAAEKHKGTFIAPVGKLESLFEVSTKTLAKCSSSHYRYWTQSFCRRVGRSLLHRWKLEPSKEFRACCR